MAGGCESARGVADRPGGGRHPGPGPEEASAMQVRSPLPLLQQWYVSQNPFIILFIFILFYFLILYFIILYMYEPCSVADRNRI